MSINIVLCEDKQVVLNTLKTHMEKAIKKNGIDVKVSFTTESTKKILEYAKQYVEGINAYFLDINLGMQMNGLELAKQIRSYDPHCYITFVTGHPELCMTVFKYHIEAFEYLIKPVSYQALEECLLSINNHYVNFMHYQKNNKNAVFMVRSGNCEYKLDLQDIIFVESDKQKLVIHTANKKIEFFGYLKDIIDELNRNGVQFYRCHRSYIVNISHIKEVDYKDAHLIMSNGEKCYMARQQKGEIKELMDRMVYDHDDCI